MLSDPSVVLGFLRGEKTAKVAIFDRAPANRYPVGIDAHVYQEGLQGALTDKEWRQTDALLSPLVIYRLTQGIDSYRDAARIYFDCRRKGLTVRNRVDCLIAQTALENNVPLLARDRDYEAIARVPPLRFA